jgi:diacylglycerol kinase (ATP)
VVPTAKLTDGLLTVAAYRRFSKLELFRHFWSISRGKRKYSPKIETFTAAEVTISAAGPLEIHLDGVPCGRAPKTLVAVPKALKVFASADLQ